MGMLAAVQGAVAPGAEDRICMRLRARMGELSASSWSIGPGRALAAALICAVAILMLFGCGYVFGTRSGLQPWGAGLSMVALGSALVGVAVALGG